MLRQSSILCGKSLRDLPGPRTYPLCEEVIFSGSELRENYSILHGAQADAHLVADEDVGDAAAGVAPVAMLPGGSMMEGHIYDDLMPADHDLKGYHKIGYKVYLKDGMNSKGPWSMYSMRLRECQQMFWKGFYTDPFIMDWGFTNNYKYYLLNPAMYAPVHLTFVLYVWCVMMALSEIALCPDVQVMRRQERYHSKPDCFRLHSYAIPYFNHRLRNIVKGTKKPTVFRLPSARENFKWVFRLSNIMRKYRWVFIQNEPDWNDYCYSGMRPDGVQGHHVPWVRNSLNYVSYKYYEEDPLATSCSHINFERIHHNLMIWTPTRCEQGQLGAGATINLNYKIQERWLEEGETMPEFQTGPQYAASEGGGD
eukprot:g10392.t1